MGTPPTVLLFVYGTLRTPVGGPAADTRNYEFVADHVVSSTLAVLHDAELLSFIHYPGTRRGEGSVIGELLELTDEGLEITDEIESHPDFFERQLASVETNEAICEAWVYWAPDQLLEAGQRIASGDWFDRDRSIDDGRTLDQALVKDKEANRAGLNDV